MNAERHHPSDPRLERLTFFSDAVFAIAITLLIIEIHGPEIGPLAPSAAWIHAILHLVPKILAFALSFLVIGAVWASHHETLSLLSGWSRRLVWPNLFLLMSVAFLPLPTSLLGNGSLSPVPFVFYSGSLVSVGLLKAWTTTVALDPALIAPGVPPARIAIERRRRIVMPGVSLIFFLLSFVVPAWSALAMLLLPVALRLPAFRIRDERQAVPAS